MRIEMELFGQVLSIYLGPGVDVEDEVEEAVEPGPERLYAADLSHSEWHPDPVFPTLDWGDDEERAGRVDLGREHQHRKPGKAEGDGPRFGFHGGR